MPARGMLAEGSADSLRAPSSVLRAHSTSSLHPHYSSSPLASSSRVGGQYWCHKTSASFQGRLILDPHRGQWLTRLPGSSERVRWIESSKNEPRDPPVFGWQPPAESKIGAALTRRRSLDRTKAGELGLDGGKFPPSPAYLRCLMQQARREEAMEGQL